MTSLPLQPFGKTTTDNDSLLHPEDFGTAILMGSTLTSDANSNVMLLELPHSDQAKKKKNEKVWRSHFKWS